MMAAAESVLRQALPAALPASLAQAHAYWRGVPPTALLVGHCLFTATLAPEAKPWFMLHYWLTFLGGFAGGPLSALLIMNPAKAPISLLHSNTTGLTWTLCWWLMTYSPLAPTLNALFELKPVKAACKACVAFNRASLVASRVLLAATLFPGVYMAPILIGAVSICGGKCTFDAIRHLYGLATGPSEVTVPTYSFRSAFLGASLFYLASVCPFTRFLTPEEGAGALITLFVLHSLMADLLGLKADWSDILMRVLLRVCNIPYPEGIPTTASGAGSKATGQGAGAAHKGHEMQASAAAFQNGLQHAQRQAAVGATAVNPTRPVAASTAAPAAAAGPAMPAQQQHADEEEEAAAPVGAPSEQQQQQQGSATGAAQRKSRRKKGSAGAVEDGWQVVPSKQRRPAVAAAAAKKAQ